MTGFEENCSYEGLPIGMAMGRSGDEFRYSITIP